jgi:hypothetical protein
MKERAAQRESGKQKGEGKRPKDACAAGGGEEATEDDGPCGESVTRAMLLEHMLHTWAQ